MLVFSATITFAQSNKQVEPVKQLIESEDIKKEIKETPDSETVEPDSELDKLDNSVDEELELLEEETNEIEMKEEEVEELEEEKMIEEKAKKKLNIQPNEDLKSEDE